LGEGAGGLRFSHVGLFVVDMARMVDFYSRVLGFAVTDRGTLGDAGLTFLSRDPGDHHQIVLVDGRPPGLPDRIVNQISFRVAALGELIAFHRRIRAEAPRDLVSVSHGNAWSVYFRDPEGNRIEVFADTPWHVPQPVREPIDLDRPEDAILAETEAFCRARPGFRPMAEWRQEIARRIAAHPSG
jgi:catechol 2,3-dioxygenase-like lactoylglutathione lyase family enzyme